MIRYLILIYLMGVLLSFGIISSCIIYKLYDEYDLSKIRLLIYGSIASWITVIIFVIGFIIGLLNNE